MTQESAIRMCQKMNLIFHDFHKSSLFSHPLPFFTPTQIFPFLYVIYISTHTDAHVNLYRHTFMRKIYICEMSEITVI